MQLWIIGVLCISALRTYVPPVEATPVGSSSAGSFAFYRPGGEQSSPFAEGIRDWFRNLKNRFFGGSDPQALPPAEAANMMMELEKEDREQQRRNYSGGFFLDLTNLTFDPDRDWGFRLGQWYFIRKPNDETASNNWKSSNYPEWPTMDEGKDYDRDPPLITMKSNDVTTTVASTSSEESSEVTEPTAATEANDADNETYDRPESMQSAEVLLPLDQNK